MIVCACVLKSGGQYTYEHVKRLEDQLGPLVPLTVFTDDAKVIADRGSLARRLTYHLPGWWSKMELFNPAYPDDIIYFDLDTIIRRSPRLLLTRPQVPMILRDVYRPDGLQSSVMAFPHFFKQEVWDAWMSGPETWMKDFAVGGDQAFLEYVGKHYWKRLQDLYPGEYVSWKADLAHGAVRPSPEARVVFFHGDPKPWDLNVTQLQALR